MQHGLQQQMQQDFGFEQAWACNGAGAAVAAAAAGPGSMWQFEAEEDNMLAMQQQQQLDIQSAWALAMQQRQQQQQVMQVSPAGAAAAPATAVSLRQRLPPQKSATMSCLMPGQQQQQQQQHPGSMPWTDAEVGCSFVARSVSGLSMLSGPQTAKKPAVAAALPAPDATSKLGLGAADPSLMQLLPPAAGAGSTAWPWNITHSNVNGRSMPVGVAGSSLSNAATAAALVAADCSEEKLDAYIDQLISGMGCGDGMDVDSNGLESMLDCSLTAAGRVAGGVAPSSAAAGATGMQGACSFSVSSRQAPAGAAADFHRTLQ
jgi:hypothetical protein